MSKLQTILNKFLEHENEAKTLIDMEEQLDLLEKSILSKAFRGELGTNDLNDEPAIELLKKSLKKKMSQNKPGQSTNVLNRMKIKK